MATLSDSALPGVWMCAQASTAASIPRSRPRDSDPTTMATGPASTPLSWRTPSVVSVRHDAGAGRSQPRQYLEHFAGAHHGHAQHRTG